MASRIIPAFLFFASCIYRGEGESSPAELLYLLYTPSKILIIGDSLTDLSDGFYLRDYSNPNSRISHRGIQSADYTEWYFKLDEAFALEPFPDHVIIALGTNDGYRFTAQEFQFNVNKFNEQIKGRTSGKVYYCLVPRTMDAGLVQKIIEQNNILRQNPPSQTAGLIDLESAFLNAPVSVPLYLTDIIHPTGDGYRLIGQTIANAINPR